MTSRQFYPRYWLSALLVFVIALAFLASGCVWGVVRDAETGAPIAGAEVTIDSRYNFRQAITDANGIYSFDTSLGSPALPGEASFFISAQGFQARKEIRSIEYPGANFSDASTFRSLQVFDLPPRPGGYHDMILGYSVAFPPDWEIWAHPMATMSNMEAHPKMGDGFCGIDSEEIQGSETPETWWQDRGSVYDVVERQDAQVAGMSATRLVYENDSYLGRPIKGVLFLFQRGSRAWVIRCYTGAETFNAEVGVFDAVAASFKFD